MADTSRFTIICPCCEATLTIDAQTGALISHEEKANRWHRLMRWSKDWTSKNRCVNRSSRRSSAR